MTRSMIIVLGAGLMLLGAGPDAGVAHAQLLRPVLLQISEAEFSRPHDLVLSPDGKFLYVADVGNDAVQVLDPATLKVVGKIGADDLDSPHDVAFDKQGQLLVADTGNDRIAIYRVQGARGQFAGELKGGLDSPEGVAPLPDGRVVVTNAGSHDVVVLFKEQVVSRFGRGGSGPQAYVRPHDLIADPEGRLYVTDPGNNRIHILDRNFRQIGLIGPPTHSFNEPKYLHMDGKGRLYVSDEYNNVVKIFDRDLHRVAIIPPARGGRAIRLNQPEGVTAREGRVWISDTYNNRIVLYELRTGP